MAQVLFPEIFRDALESKVIPALNLVTDFFSDEEGVMKKYRGLQNKNLTLTEDIYIRTIIDKFTESPELMSPSLYVHNGYMTMNSADRFVFIPIDDLVVHFNNPHVTLFNGSNSEIENINSFVINSELDVKESQNILKICYAIADAYFVNMMMYNTRENVISRYYNMYCQADENLVNRTSLPIQNFMFAVDRIITCIRLLDQVFDLKFRDKNDVLLAVKYVYENKEDTDSSFECILKAFDLVYEYAIDKDLDEYNYEVIYSAALKF